MFQILAMRTTSFSLTPCFSWVVKCADQENHFNGLPHPAETVETRKMHETAAKSTLGQ